MVDNPFSRKEDNSIKESVETKLENEMREELEHEKILREHGYLESNIPLNHPRYWKIRP